MSTEMLSPDIREAQGSFHEIELDGTEIAMHVDLEGIFKDQKGFFKDEQTVLDLIDKLFLNEDNNLNEVKDEHSGDTLLHYAAKYNFELVVITLLKLGMDALAKNKEGNNALEIAINNERDDMSSLIARHIDPSDLRGLFDGKTFSELIYPKYFTETIQAVLDSLRIEKAVGSDVFDTKLLVENKNGNLPGDDSFNYKDHSVFQLLAEKGHKETINQPVLKLLINYKWKEWARKRFLKNLVLYLLSLFSLTFSVAVAATSANVKEYDTRLQHARAAFEIVAYGFIIKAIVNEVIQFVRHGLGYCTQLLNWLELISAVLVFLVLPVRYINVQAHWYIFAAGYFLWALKIFKYAIVFSETGAYAESLRTIFWRNILPFSLLFCIVNLVFGGTFILVLKGDGDLDTHEETSSIWGIWFVGLRTMIEAQAIVEYTGSEGYRPMGTIIMLIFMVVTIVVLLNILIAQLTETYRIIQNDARKSVVVNRAWTIARLERNTLHCPSQCIPECLKKMSPSVSTRERNSRAYYLSSKGLKSNQEDSTPTDQIEQIRSALAQVQQKLVITGINEQKVKLRLTGIEKRICDVHQDLNHINSGVQQTLCHLSNH